MKSRGNVKSPEGTGAWVSPSPGAQFHIFALGLKIQVSLSPLYSVLMKKEKERTGSER